MFKLLVSTLITVSSFQLLAVDNEPQNEQDQNYRVFLKSDLPPFGQPHSGQPQGIPIDGYERVVFRNDDNKLNCYNLSLEEAHRIAEANPQITYFLYQMKDSPNVGSTLDMRQGDTRFCTGWPEYYIGQQQGEVPNPSLESCYISSSVKSLAFVGSHFWYHEPTYSLNRNHYMVYFVADKGSVAASYPRDVFLFVISHFDSLDMTTDELKKINIETCAQLKETLKNSYPGIQHLELRF